MKLKVITYKTKNNQTIITLPSYLIEKYGLEGEKDFQIGRESFRAKIIKSTTLNKDGSTNTRGIITIPLKSSINLKLLNKQQIELIIKGI